MDAETYLTTLIEMRDFLVSVNKRYYMAMPVLGNFVRSDWFFLGRDFAVRTVSMEKVKNVYFCLGEKLANSKFPTKTATKNVKMVTLHSETTRKS